jgi:hypothetical protein
MCSKLCPKEGAVARLAGRDLSGKNCHKSDLAGRKRIELPGESDRQN